MKTFGFYLIVFVTLLLTCCRNESRVVITNDLKIFSEFPRKDSLSFTRLIEYKGGVPNTFCLLDSSLVIFNYGRGAKYYLYNYDLNSGVISKGYLKKGRGPGESLGAFNFGVYRNTLWVQDVTLKKILTIDKNNILSDYDYLSFNEFPISEFYNRIVFKDSLNFYGAGNRQSPYKINEINLETGKLTNDFGEFVTIPKSIPVDACKDAYLSYIYIRPSGGKIVLPYEYTDVIEIYDIDNQSVVAMQGPTCFDVEFKVGKGSYGNFMDITKQTKKAFLGGSVTDKYIYLVYSGKFHKDNWNNASSIFVYDWDGNPVKEIIPTDCISSISVSKDDQIIYSYDRNTGFILKGYL